MSNPKLANRRLQKKKARIRRIVSGIEVRPRVSVYKSNKYLYLQAINDQAGVTICSASTIAGEVSKMLDGRSKVNVQASNLLGKEFGKLLKERGVERIVFDRNGNAYHGKLKSIADGIREMGIQF